MGRDKDEKGGITERERQLLVSYIRQRELISPWHEITDADKKAFYPTLGFKAFVVRHAILDLFNCS